MREVDIADLLNLYGITDAAEREQLLTLASQANQQGWWHRYQDVLPAWFQSYIGLEESAESIRSFDTQFVPGLLQTEDYAAAVIQLGAYSREETRPAGVPAQGTAAAIHFGRPAAVGHHRRGRLAPPDRQSRRSCALSLSTCSRSPTGPA